MKEELIEDNIDLSRLDCLVLGQLLTSRTEVVEEFLRPRTSSVCVVALAGFQQWLRSRVTSYDKGLRISYSIPFANHHSFSRHILALISYYFAQIISIVYAISKLRRRFYLVFGISTFYALIALLLRRFGVVRHVIYYSLDYYPQESFINTVFRKMDAYCVQHSDVVWNLSPAIARARYNQTSSAIEQVREFLVPLTYGEQDLVSLPLSDIDRSSLAFVGTLEKLQGLELVVRALPIILEKFPNIKVKVIGDGPYANDLKSIIKDARLEECFEFYGFLEKEEEVRRIISHCAIGLAPYIPTRKNNAMNADPGKPKFYTFMGLPVIMTKMASGFEIAKDGAGIAIDYEPSELASAVFRILGTQETFSNYRKNTTMYARKYTSERIFGRYLNDSLEFIERRGRK